MMLMHFRLDLGEDSTIRIWDIAESEAVAELPSPSSASSVRDISLCKNMLAAAFEDNTVRIWNLRQLFGGNANLVVEDIVETDGEEREGGAEGEGPSSSASASGSPASGTGSESQTPQDSDDDEQWSDVCSQSQFEGSADEDGSDEDWEDIESGTSPNSNSNSSEEGEGTDPDSDPQPGVVPMEMETAGTEVLRTGAGTSLGARDEDAASESSGDEEGQGSSEGGGEESSGSESDQGSSANSGSDLEGEDSGSEAGSGSGGGSPGRRGENEDEELSPPSASGQSPEEGRMERHEEMEWREEEEEPDGALIQVEAEEVVSIVHGMGMGIEEGELVLAWFEFLSTSYSVFSISRIELKLHIQKHDSLVLCHLQLFKPFLT
jgi:hypothetical protein